MRLTRARSYAREVDDEVVLRLNLKGIRDRRKTPDNFADDEVPLTGTHQQQPETGRSRSRSRSRARPKSTGRSRPETRQHQDTNNTDNRSVSSRRSRVPAKPPVESVPRNVDSLFSFDTTSVMTGDESLNSHMSGHSNAARRKSTGDNKKQRQRFAEESAIKKLIIEDLWSDSPSMVEKGLKKLSSILGMKRSVPNAQRNRDTIFRAGGHLAIVQAMKKHKTSEAVQGEGCRALGIAAEDLYAEAVEQHSHPDRNSQNENAIATVGGIDAILFAMKQFRKNEQIQDFGCGALQNLTGMEENARIMIERDGLTVLLLSMRSFPKSTNVQESACWTIVNLCLRKEHRSRIERARCLSTVASVIDNHPRHSQLKLAAQEALQQLLILLR